MKRVIVSGGAGFIGSHVVEAYLKDNSTIVCAIDNLSSGKIDNLAKVMDNPNFQFLNADILNANEMKRIFSEFKPNIINHHAAQKSVPYSMEDPIYDANENIIGFLNLLTLCKDSAIEKFVYVSSGGALSKEIIGDEISREDDIPQLASPYAITKYTGEQYLQVLSKYYGIDYTILRYANVYGPRQIRDGESGVVPIFVENILEGKSSVLMTYDDMPRGCTRDYVYIEDVVSANMLASNATINAVVNISSGIETPILDIYEIIQKEFDSNQPINIQGPRLGDVKRSVLNNEKARNILNWTPKVTLKDGVKKLKEFYKNA